MYSFVNGSENFLNAQMIPLSFKPKLEIKRRDCASIGDTMEKYKLQT